MNYYFVKEANDFFKKRKKKVRIAYVIIVEMMQKCGRKMEEQSEYGCFGWQFVLVLIWF